VKILLTSRDAGSAYQQVALIQNLLKIEGDLSYLFLSQHPATTIIEQHGLQCKDCTKNASDSDGQMQINVEEALGNFGPDFVLVGLSWQQWGVDEYVMQESREKGIPTGAIQDYWGYVGQFDSELHPDVFFVCHQDAADLTQKNLGSFVRTLAVGSPKHEAYAAVAEVGRRRSRGRLGRGVNVVFMGQPFVIPGIRENFEIFLRGLQNCDEKYRVVFKPHPADPESAKLCSVLAASRIRDFRVASDSEPSEMLLLDSDIVVTCFSTAGVDHNYLQRFSKTHIGELIYLLCGEIITDTIGKAIGQTSIPYADRGLGIQCRNENEFKEALCACFSDSDSGYRQATFHQLPEAGYATSAIHRYVSQAINTR
jgi:hypothetical protein